MQPSSRPSPAAAVAAQRCSAAADAAAQCASDCLADPRVYDLEECIEWCLLGSQMLGSCAQVLGRRATGGREEVIGAAARAALLVAEGCRTAARNGTATLASCGTAAAACDAAAAALGAYLDSAEALQVEVDPTVATDGGAPAPVVGAQALATESAV